jgi:hypothetical protein
MLHAEKQLEDSCMKIHGHIWRIVVLCSVAGAALAACGGSSPSSSGGSKTPSTTSSAPSTAASITAITANWEKFFSAKTPVATRQSLLENGSQFPASTLAPTGLAAEASAKVLSVSAVTPADATVKYNILLGTSVALPNQTGQAVYQGGTWKVGTASFCSLLKLEDGNKTSSLPAVCKASASASATP